MRYSPQELRALKALPLNGEKMLTSELVEAIYKNVTPPFHAGAAVTSVLRNLIKKVEINGERFQIKKSKPSGPSEIVYWREER
jgi:hypothetical protein